MTDMLPLLDEEHRIREVEGTVCEIAYNTGEALRDFRGNEKYKQVGFDTWSAYCRSERIPYNKQQADRLITFSHYRKALPDLPDGTNTWTELNVRPLTQYEKMKDVTRMATKVVEHVEATGEPLTSKLVSRFVEEDFGLPEKRRKARLEKKKGREERQRLREQADKKRQAEHQRKTSLAGSLSDIMSAVAGATIDWEEVPADAWKLLDDEVDVRQTTIRTLERALTVLHTVDEERFARPVETREERMLKN